ncbi:MAG: dihydrofolate reductase family protein [Thermoplasmata archaeon]|nr:dihydrofolate reductase family protein [Thermoplasmata archaeon]
MRKVLMLMYMTLDGIAEFPEYAPQREGTPEEEGPRMWSSRLETIDTLLLGRRTYEKWAEFWPGKKDNPALTRFERQFSEFADHVDKVVFSKTLPSADWPGSRIVRGDPGEEIFRLKSLPGRDMALVGPRLAQSFLERDLIDEMVLEISPCIVGKGKPLFHVDADPEHDADAVPVGAPGRHDFLLIETLPQRDGSVMMHYKRGEPRQESH